MDWAASSRVMVFSTGGGSGSRSISTVMFPAAISRRATTVGLSWGSRYIFLQSPNARAGKTDYNNPPLLSKRFPQDLRFGGSDTRGAVLVDESSVVPGKLIC